MSVSGYERRALPTLCERYGSYFDRIEEDAMGNLLLWHLCAKEGRGTILIDAHFDEIGMMVSEILDGGFLRVASVGGLDEAVLQASDVCIYGKETLRGVIASTPPHLQNPKDKKKLCEIRELLIDTSLPREELCEIVRVGTPVGFSPVYHELQNRTLVGKSFDNKACGAASLCAVASTPREELAADVCLLFSCHEETVRLGGVAPAASAVNPDYAMVIDVNLARVPDTPESETVPFGKGVSLSISAVTDRRLTRMTRALCEDKGIRHTMIAAPSSTGTNAVSLNLVGRGVPVVDVGLPLKSMHTYAEMLSLDDARELQTLVSAFIRSEKIREVFAL